MMKAEDNSLLLLHVKTSYAKMKEQHKETMRCSNNRNNDDDFRRGDDVFLCGWLGFFVGESFPKPLC
jgi:hypothetical protein